MQEKKSKKLLQGQSLAVGAQARNTVAAKIAGGQRSSARVARRRDDQTAEADAERDAEKSAGAVCRRIPNIAVAARHKRLSNLDRTAERNGKKCCCHSIFSLAESGVREQRERRVGGGVDHLVGAVFAW